MTTTYEAKVGYDGSFALPMEAEAETLEQAKTSFREQFMAAAEERGYNVVPENISIAEVREVSMP